MFAGILSIWALCRQLYLGHVIQNTLQCGHQVTLILSLDSGYA